MEADKSDKVDGCDDQEDRHRPQEVDEVGYGLEYDSWNSKLLNRISHKISWMRRIDLLPIRA